VSDPRAGPTPDVHVPDASDAAAALARFAVEGRPAGLAPHRGGLINHSWLATVDAGERRQRFLLQQINRRVFRRPEHVVENMARVTRHLAERIAGEGQPHDEQRVLSLVPTHEGTSHHVDAHGETWRLEPWIEGTRSLERAATEEQAFGTARAFGRYLLELHDLPPPRLHETIPGFHDSPARLVAFERAVGADPLGRAAGCREEILALLRRRALAQVLAERVARGEIPERPVHNDAKIANLLFGAASGEALCVVDLDTTMPGLALHDFGDLARSTVSDSAEDDPDLSHVLARPTFFAAIAEGFVEGAGLTLTALERSLLPTAAAVIVYEQALRFLTDHLEGDGYYRTERPGHNLDRARTQLRLLESLESAEATLRAAVPS
jgi:aminoglycoside phosphotransferase (APT) family kinase protein